MRAQVVFVPRLPIQVGVAVRTASGHIDSRGAGHDVAEAGRPDAGALRRAWAWVRTRGVLWTEGSGPRLPNVQLSYSHGVSSVWGRGSGRGSGSTVIFNPCVARPSPGD